MERNTYIQNNDFESALENYLKLFSTIDTEVIPTIDSVERVNSKAIYAKECDPSYNASAMDGIAVKSIDTILASDINPIILNKEQYSYVNTGNPILPKYDSVIMIEDVILKDNGNVEIISPAIPWQHIRVHGESVVISEMILPSKRKIRPIDIGAILASGNEYIEVFKKPKVGIIPTGSEMVEHASELEIGKLMESNTRVFYHLTKKYGGVPNRYKIVKDEKENLRDVILDAVENNDIVVVNAGSSAGTKDYTAKIIEELGQIITHGLAIKPGKPTILGIINNKPVIGVPGYPVSAYLVYDLVVKEVIYKLIGLSVANAQCIKGFLTKRLTSTFKNKEYVRVSLGEVDGKIVVSPLERGAAALMSMIKADGLITIDRFCEGLESGSEVDVQLLKPLSDIKKSLTITGSHDVIIDILADDMPISSAHVGSLSGIFAIKENACHIAPIHLLDSTTGEYNVSFVKKYLNNERMAIIKGLGRIQGIVIPKGNPKNIKGINDLKNNNFTFANRQKGAGTRLLFDYLLNNNDIKVEDVKGYDKEFTTHLAVADAVKNGIADMGMAVYSASKILDLDFIPVGIESYDFLLYEHNLNDERIKRFIELLKSKEFKCKVEKLGGYSFDRIGEVELINNDR